MTATGQELRAMRERAGIGLRELAQAIGRDRGHLSRVERGEREPTPALIAAYQAALDPATVDDMRRRTLLFAGAALPVLALSDAPPARVGAPEVNAVRSFALDVDLNNPFALSAAESALRRAAAMLHARVSPAVRVDLHEAVALLADRVGWAQHEAGRDPAGSLGFAQRTALRGQDAELHAHAVLDIAVSTSDSRCALAALDHALTGPVAGAERANLHAVAARRAATADPRAARERLAAALDTEPTPSNSEWAQHLTGAPGHLDAIIGFACYALDHPAARSRLAAAAAAMDPNRRTRARCHARLAGLAVLDGDHDEAAEQLSQATRVRRPSLMLTNDLRAFAVTARAAGRPDLARHAVAHR